MNEILDIALGAIAISIAAMLVAVVPMIIVAAYRDLIKGKN